MHALPESGYVRIKTIIGDPKAGIPAIIPVSKSTWWDWCRRGIAPPALHLSPGVTVWDAAAVQNMARSAANDATPVESAQSTASNLGGNSDEAWKQKPRARKGASA